MTLKKLKVDKDWTLFLDRDGVINKKLENDYVKDFSEFSFTTDAIIAIKKFNELFKYTIVVTNQQGIAKGLMTGAQLETIHQNVQKHLNENNAYLDAFFYCPDKMETNSLYRKPNIGMALLAKKKHPDINFKKSIMVGDSLTDMQFGKKLKMTTVFISPTIIESQKYPDLIDLNFESLFDFSKYLNSL